MKKHQRSIMIATIFTTAICYSCKKTTIPSLSTPPSQDVQILGNWSLIKTTNSVIDKKGTVLTDSIKASKGYTDDLSFNEKGFRLRDKIVNYKIVKLKNENYLTYSPYDEVVMLKITQKNDVSFILENSDSTSIYKRVTKYYFQKD